MAAGKALLARQPFEPGDLDEVVLGCIIPGPDEANIARIVALRLGCGKAMPAWTVQRNCGSGMQAIACAAQDIAQGRADLVLAGGTEAMSRCPVLLGDPMVKLLADLARGRSAWAKLRVLGRLRPSHFVPVVSLLRGLTDPISGLNMGQTAEGLASRFGISRERMDGFALRSHQRLARAQDGGRLEEIAPMAGPDGTLYDRDEGLRRDADAAALARLKPAFEPPHGLVTAGNSAQITDGAACLLLASADAVRKYGLNGAGPAGGLPVGRAGAQPDGAGPGARHGPDHARATASPAPTWTTGRSTRPSPSRCWPAPRPGGMPAYCAAGAGPGGPVRAHRPGPAQRGWRRAWPWATPWAAAAPGSSCTCCTCSGATAPAWAWPACASAAARAGPC